MEITIKEGDCLTEMPKLSESSIDAIVSDPPYGLSFMGRTWDHGVPGSPFWVEALRVLKPGAHMLAFGGTRTYHRLTVAIEEAGFEIRDCLGWIYGSGFPKSLDISKAIDKAAGKEREKIPRIRPDGKLTGQKGAAFNACNVSEMSGPALTPEAAKWSGFGTALKPAWEPVILARKPLAGTVAENVLEYGTGGLNIDRCRIETDLKRATGGKSGTHKDAPIYGDMKSRAERPDSNLGRFPANLIHDGSPEVLAIFPETKSGDPGKSFRASARFAGANETGTKLSGFGDSGSAARFFYCSKASRSNRGPENDHPTVKPTDLLRYLCRLICPPGGTVLDPFMGSGSTGKAAIAEGFSFIGIEIDPHYCEIAAARLSKALEEIQDANPKERD